MLGLVGAHGDVQWDSDLGYHSMGGISGGLKLSMTRFPWTQIGGMMAIVVPKRHVD